MRSPGRKRRGFTLLEVVFAVAILTIGALMLTVALSSSERMNSLARERAIANNVIRAYIERQRNTYPFIGSQDMSCFVMQRPTPGGAQPSTTAAVPLTDPSVPTFDLQALYANGTVERNVLKNVVARVSMATFEDGYSFGAVYSTDTTIAPLTTGANSMSADDKNALGLPRDLNGDGTVTAGTSANGPPPGADILYLQCAATPVNIVCVPVKIELSWTSGSANTVNAGNRQSMTVYAILNASH